jgi:NAD(P)-dependent dehydrogenase (short-subunit alcohol dehydrogenase family)
MILVTGATGNVGRQVVNQLIDAGERVRAISRDPARAGLPAGVEVLPADLREPGGLPVALDGVDAAYLFPVRGHLGGFLSAARKAGLCRVVLLSSLAVTSSSLVRALSVARSAKVGRGLGRPGGPLRSRGEGRLWRSALPLVATCLRQQCRGFLADGETALRGVA